MEIGIGVTILAMFFGSYYFLANYFVQRRISQLQKSVVKEALKIEIVAAFAEYLETEGKSSDEDIILTLETYFRQKEIFYGIAVKPFDVQSENHLQLLCNHLLQYNSGIKFNETYMQRNFNFDGPKDILSQIYKGITPFTPASHDESMANAAG